MERRESMGKERTNKGNSLLQFPNDYTIVDLETTGLSPDYDYILEVAAIKVRNGVIVDTFSSLVKAEEDIWIDPFITELTGITREMISNAPDIRAVFPEFISFIGTDIIIGHNANFDINFIYDNLEYLFGKYLDNDFVDTMRISRRLHPEERHHRLADLSARYQIDYSSSHRALSDCEITKKCFDAMLGEVHQKYSSEEEFWETVKKSSSGLYAKGIVGDPSKVNPDCPLYGKVCAFTGTLQMTRKEAMQIVADLGGIVADNVTQKTNYLIMGVTDYSVVKGGKSAKRKKAEKLQLAGNDISVISEDVFYEMIK